MRFIKLGVISFFLLVAIVMAISFLLPSKVIVSRSVDINLPIDSIYNKVNNLPLWNEWLINRDTLPINISMIYGRKTLSMGNTTVYIVSSTPYQVNTNWRVNKGKTMPGVFNLSQHPNTPITTVQWLFEQNLEWYPWEKFAAAISDKVLGPFMEQSLANLKKNLEYK